MSMYQDSSAYDFDMFEEHIRKPSVSVSQTAPALKPEKEQPILKKVAPKSRVQRRAEERNTGMRMLLLTMFVAVVFGVVCLQLAAGAQRYELTKQIAAVETQLKTAQSENIRLNTQLSGVTSIGKIDSYAVNILGMSKLENYQVEYIDMSEGDKVIYSGEKTADNGNGLIARMFAYIKDLSA